MNKNFAKYIFSLLLFGLNGILASRIYIPSYDIVFLRTFLGTILLTVIFLCTKNKFTFFNYKKDFLYMLLCGVSTGLSWIFLYEAYNLTGVGIASLAYYTGPVIVMALSPLLFKEKLSSKKILSFIIVFTGLVFLSSQCLKNASRTKGLVLGLLSAVMYAFMIIFNKKAKRINGMENSILTIGISSAFVFIYILIKREPFAVIPRSSILPLLILGFVNTGFGCFLYYSSIKHLSVSTVSICGYLEPLSSVIFSILLLNESFTKLQLAGIVLILTGAVLSQIKIFSRSKHVYVQRTKAA